MYRNLKNDQLDIYDFILPFGGHLKEDNRWVKLRKMINWEMVREIYGSIFENKDAGREAYPGEVAFGALYIQSKLGVTYRELVDQIAENPYMQYFIGYKEYRNERPFDPSLLVSFRKRLPESAMSEILERTFIAHCGVKDTQEGVPENAGAPENDIDNGSGNDGNGSDSNAGTGSVSDSHEASEGSDEEANPANKGTLIIDATCAPPTLPTPQTLTCATRLRYQLGCIDRNLGYISEYEKAHGLTDLKNIENERLATIRTFHAQHKEMFENRTHSIPDRIVSLAQPWVRPIVRGKAKSPTEFGAKVSISVITGYAFVDRISFDAYNEGEAGEFVRTVENYRRRFGRYPERVLADKLYRSRANRAFCKKHGIRISGPRLGCPAKIMRMSCARNLRKSASGTLSKESLAMANASSIWLVLWQN